MNWCAWTHLMDPSKLPGLYDDLALLESMKGTARRTLGLPREVAFGFAALFLCMNLFMLCTWSLASGEYSLVAVVGMIVLDCCATAVGMNEYHQALRLAEDGQELMCDIEWQIARLKRRIEWIEMDRDLMKEKEEGQ